MTMIETSPPKVAAISPEKQKRIDNYTRADAPQEHGSAPEQKGHQWERILRTNEFGRDRKGTKKRLNEHLNSSLNEDGTADPDEGLFDHLKPESAEYSSYSSDYNALEAAADAILGEAAIEPEIHDISPSQEKEVIREVVSSALVNSNEYELVSLYRALYSRGFELQQELSPNDVTSELAHLVDFIEDQAELIAEELQEMREGGSQDARAVSKAELGLPDKKRIIKEMTRRVTLDSEYDEDDLGDNDFAPGVHETDRT